MKDILRKFSEKHLILNKFIDQTYLWLILEKGIKIFISFFIVYLLKRDGLFDLISLYGIIELSSFMLSSVSILGTDLVAQREFSDTNKLNKTFNVFFSSRFFSSVFIFIFAVLGFDFLIDHPTKLVSKIALCSFVFLSPFQTVEFFLYGISKFSLVYKLKTLATLFGGGVKILVFYLKPELIIYTVSFDFILLFILFSIFMIREKIVLKIKFVYLNFFLKNFFIKTSFLFLASVIVSFTNHFLFYTAKKSISPYEVSNLYIFLKVAEGLNFLSLNLALILIPKMKRVSLMLNLELKKVFSNKNNFIYFLISLMGLSLLFTSLFYIYKIDHYFISIILSLFLFFLNGVQIFMGVNFVFKKREFLKLIMNFSTISFLVIISTLFKESSFLNYVYVLIFSKLASIFFLQFKFNKS